MSAITKRLSLPIDDDIRMAEKVQAGISSDVIGLLNEALGLGSIAKTAALFNMSAKTAERRVLSRALLKPAEAERVIRIVRIMSRAESVFENKENAKTWMFRPLALLGDKTPLQMCQTEPGARAVEQALGRIEHGVFA